MATNDLTSAIEQSHAALGAILKGDPSVYQALYSLADDVTLGNPFGPYVRGRQKVNRSRGGLQPARPIAIAIARARLRPVLVIVPADRVARFRLLLHESRLRDQLAIVHKRRTVARHDPACLRLMTRL
jgi:hypothetical protein